MSHPCNPLEAILARWMKDRNSITLPTATEIRRSRHREDDLGEVARRRHRRAKAMNLRVISEARHRHLMDRSLRILTRVPRSVPSMTFHHAIHDMLCEQARRSSRPA